MPRTKKNSKQTKKNFPWKRPKGPAFYLFLRVIVVIIISTATIFTVYIGRRPYGEELKEGDVSLRTFFSPLNFKYRLGIDEEKTKLEREKAASALDDIYDIDSQLTQDLINKLDKFFSQIVSVQSLKDIKEEERLIQLKSGLEVDIPESNLRVLLAEPIAELSTKTEDLLKQFLLRGVLPDAAEQNLIKSGRNAFILRNLDTKLEAKVPLENILTLDKAKKELANNIQSLIADNRKLKTAITDLVQKIIEVNSVFNEKLTNERRKLAYDNTPVQYKEKEVKKDELIIARGERVAKEHLLKIKQLAHLQIKVNHFMFFSGATILTLIFLVIIALYLKTYEPKIYLGTRKLTLVSVLFILILGLAKAITYSPLPSYIIPTAIASILIAMLLGARLAIIITVALSIFVGIIVGDKLNVTCVSFVGGIIGIFFIQGARRRSQILITGFFVGIANFFAICAMTFLYGLEEYTIFLKEGFWGMVNGLGSAVIITGVLPVFEYLFNIATDISLLELSDLNHPLLKEMVLKVPGTYHHSLIVGNLAEAACDAIGANSLLARVGSYFHDIGKIEKAEYFSENQIGLAKSKHDKLTPSMSSLIITNHVKDGKELAQKYKLNQVIIDFIEQHHGTSLIFYFYQRALEKIENEELLLEEGFRYPGPKPQTKETAVVLLADSVEAASRTLSEPTPARIKGLVRKIINNKFIDNQLDQCELTLKDLEVIANIFTHILLGIFHSRVEYEPTENTIAEDKNKKQPEKNNHK